MTETVLDLAAARRWAVTSRALLSDFRAQIDALNVFPVPDGDTGTNMFLTVDGALSFLRNADEGESSITLGEGLALLARGMLLSARGNSGVILSQLALGMAQAVERAGPGTDEMSPQVLSEALELAADVAWSGVSAPVEGTILSVARAAAEGAELAISATASTGQAEPLTTHGVALAALQAAKTALAKTPEQLPSLARAGVVDAGGAGFVVVLEALEGVLADRPHDGTAPASSSWRSLPGEGPLWRTGGRPGADTLECVDDEGAYEVMFVLNDATAETAERLKRDLMEAGSSVLVVGGPDVWRVHVHLDHAPDAIDAGSRAGRVEQVTITALTRSLGIPTTAAPGERQGDAKSHPALALLCCAPGEGLAHVFAEAGASVVHSSAGNRASTGQLLSAARETSATAVVILPNDPDTVLAARAAARAGTDEGLNIAVVPTLAAVQGLAAVSVWDPDTEDVDQSVVTMREAAGDVRYGALTVAASQGDTPVGPCRTGQWLGLVAGEIIAVEDRAGVVAHAVLTEMAARLAQEPEMLTVIEGAGMSEDLGLPEEMESAVQRWSAGSGTEEVEVRHLAGGQRTYRWLLGME
ncbi:MAG: DAK2 domain-containing protein [Ornithinimicrobium sp.]